MEEERRRGRGDRQPLAEYLQSAEFRVHATQGQPGSRARGAAPRGARGTRNTQVPTSTERGVPRARDAGTARQRARRSAPGFSGNTEHPASGKTRETHLPARGKLAKRAFPPGENSRNAPSRPAKTRETHLPARGKLAKRAFPRRCTGCPRSRTCTSPAAREIYAFRGAAPPKASFFSWGKLPKASVLLGEAPPKSVGFTGRSSKSVRLYRVKPPKCFGFTGGARAPPALVGKAE